MDRQQWAIIGYWKKILKDQFKLKDVPGIYLFYRTNEDNEKCVYVGQSVKILTRCAEHLATKNKSQHIDKSLYIHKMYNEKNPNGWKVSCLCQCVKSQLDGYEQFYIEHYVNLGYKVYNTTGGGQIDKLQDINQRQKIKLKSYSNGKNYGYDKAINQVKVYFDKYLDFTIKGKITKTKLKKLEEFKKFIGE